MSKLNYFNNIHVDGYNYPATPQANFKFVAIGLSLLNRGSHTIQYSFDGVDTHGDLNPSDATAGLVFDNRHEDVVYLKGVDGYATVRVEAWGSY